jgi:hypothetical protein
MEFRAWLEDIEEYEPYRARIDAQYRNFVFGYMFVGADQNGRIFIPFVSDEISDEDKKVVHWLGRTLGDHGYELVDIKAGYARQKGKSNLVRVGKLLDTLRYKDLKELERQRNAGEISQIKYDSEKRLAEKHYEETKSEFENMPFRAGSELAVVISMNPHDLASMSTGRGWSSCMNLQDGAHKKDVYCEVRNGGFIAYLIRKEDQEIKKPIARIHIRRFDNKSGRSVAVPEESVYGTDKEGFLQTVKSWLVRAQGNLKPGPYKRVGGSYSDTFGSDRGHFVRPESEDNETIMGWINKWMGMKREKQSKYSQYMIQALASLVSSKGDYPKEFVLKVRDFLFGKQIEEEPKYGSRGFEGSTIPVKKGWNQNTDQFAPRFALRFPDVITKPYFVHAFTYAINNVNQVEMADKLAEEFPQFADQEMLKAAKDSRMASRIAEKVPSLSSHHLAMLEDDVEQNLKLDNPEFSVREGDPNARSASLRDPTSVWEVQHKITSTMDKLSNFKPIPDRLSRKLVDFANGADRLKLSSQGEYDEEVKKNHQSQAIQSKNTVVRHAIHVFGITNTDTPTVQRFYEGLLPKWEEAGGIGTLGWGISSLFENGRSFLPFLKKKREEVKNMDVEEVIKDLRNPMGPKHYEEMKEKTLEMFDYVIDSLEKGKPSKKYSKTYGVLLDAFIYDQKVRDMSHGFFRRVIGGKK